MTRFHHLGLFVRDLEFGLIEFEKVIEFKDATEVTNSFGSHFSVLAPVRKQIKVAFFLTQLNILGALI